jgi:hypothetical protein
LSAGATGIELGRGEQRFESVARLVGFEECIAERDESGGGIGTQRDGLAVLGDGSSIAALLEEGLARRECAGREGAGDGATGDGSCAGVEVGAGTEEPGTTEALAFAST